MSGMNPTLIKQPRLSEESTTESSTSGSGDSEVDRLTTDDESKLPNFTGPWATEEEFLMYAETLPAIAGRYTDADPDFRNDQETKTPPVLPNYNPRKHDQRGGGGGGGGGGRGGRQNWGGHNQGNYGQGHRDNRGYNNRDRDSHHQHRNQGGDGNRGNNRYHGHRDGDRRRYDDRQGR